MDTGKHLICGPFQPFLEERLTEEVGRAKAGTPLSPVLVLVGSHALALYLEKMLADRLGAHANFRALTLRDFCERVAWEEIRDKAAAPAAVKGRILRGITRSMNEGDYFAGVRERPGFISALLSTFDDLEQGGFTGRVPKGCPPKVKQVFELYGTFGERLRADFTENADVLREAAARVGSTPELFGTSRVILYGLYDLTEMQKRLIQSIAASLEVAFLLPFEDRSAFDFARPTLEWLAEIGFKAGGSPALNRAATSLEAVQKGEGVHGRPAGNDADDGTIAIRSAPGEAREIHEIAREILTSAREPGIPFGDTAVVLRSRGDYLQLITEEFDRLGIPHYISGGLPLSYTREGRSLLLLLELFTGDLPRVKVTEFLRFAPLDLEHLTSRPLPPDAPELWNKISAEANIVRGREQWEERLKAHIGGLRPEGDGRGSARSEAGDLQAVVNALFKGMDTVPPEGSPGGLSGPLLGLYRSFVKESPVREKVIEAVGELAGSGERNGPLPRDEFLAMVREHLSDSAIPRGRFGSGGVNVLNIMEARGTSFRLVFIPGMVEKVFPSLAREDPLLLDHERVSLNRTGKGVVPLKREREGEERLLFTLGCSMARERLVLSYPRLDTSTGRPRIPSFFLLQAVESYTGKRANYEALEGAPGFRRAPLIPGRGLRPGDSVSLPEFHLAQAMSDEPVRADAARRFLAEDGKVARSIDLINRRYHSRHYGEFDGMLGAGDGWRRLSSRILPDDRVFRASELEDYTKCPYLFFHKRVLRLKKFDEPEELLVIDAPTRGTLVHEILCGFFTRCRDGGLLPIDPKDENRHLEILESVTGAHFLAAESSGVCGLPALWEREKENIRSCLTLVLDEEYGEEGRFIPTMFEVDFGTGDAQAPLEIAAGESRLRFKGRIDRIDTESDGNGIRVIDYKTGKLGQDASMPFLPKDKKGGRFFFQTMIYVLAAPSALGTGRAGVPSGENYHISPAEGRINRVTYGGSDLEAHTETLKAILSGIRDGIEKGIFIRRPERHCDYCDFANACAADRRLLFRRKESDTRVADIGWIFTGELPQSD